jgi:hypothetical protein
MCQRTQGSNLLPLTDSVGTFTCQVSRVKGSGANATIATETLTVVIAKTFGKASADRPSIWRVKMQNGSPETDKHLLKETSKVMFPSGSTPPQGVAVDVWYSVVPSGSFFFELVDIPVGAGAVLPLRRIAYGVPLPNCPIQCER